MLNPGSHSRQASLSPLRGIPPATFHLESCILSGLCCSGFRQVKIQGSNEIRTFGQSPENEVLAELGSSLPAKEHELWH